MLFKPAGWLVVLLLVLAVSFSAGCGEVGEGEEEQKGVAVVNGEEIGYEEFEFYLQQVKSMYEMQGMDLESEEMEEMLASVEQQVLDELINRRLLLQEAEKKDFSVSEDAVQEELEQLEQHFGGEEMLTEELETMDMTVDDLKEDLYQQLTIQEYVEYYLDKEVDEMELEVTEEEIEELYDQYSAHQDLPEMEEIEPQLREELEQQKIGQVMQMLSQQLREESEIEVYL